MGFSVGHGHPLWQPSLLGFGATVPQARKAGPLTTVAAMVLAAVSPANAHPQPQAAQRDEARVALACQSPLPALVVDGFPHPDRISLAQTDIDGDRVSDISHGQYVAALLKATGKPVVEAGVPHIRRGYLVATLAEVIEPLLTAIEKEARPYSHLNISQGEPIRIGLLSRLFERDANPISITRDNIATHRDEILRRLDALQPEKGFARLKSVFEDLEKRGIPVVVAAGNDGPDAVNILSLFPNTISVGALNLKGAPWFHSAHNSLVTLWRQGEHVTVKHTDGYRVLPGTPLPQFSLDEVSGQASAVDKLDGQLVTKHLKPLPTLLVEDAKRFSYQYGYVLGQLEEGLYRTEGVLDLLRGEKPEFIEFIRAKGPYVYVGKQSAVDTTFFTATADGHLTYNPLGTGQPGQRDVVVGTSFAAPLVCNTADREPVKP